MTPHPESSRLPDGADIPQRVRQLHTIYCQMTSQELPLRYDRERLWHDWLRAGFDANDLRELLNCLIADIRSARRNPGALRLSNLLQPDRFEEDLHLYRMRTKQRTNSTAPKPACTVPKQPPLTEAEDLAMRQRALVALAKIRDSLNTPQPL
jgi:hypothetical protein